MKKVLLATSALVMTAGVAAAEVTLSGDARMGIIYDGNDAQFGSRARIRFTATGESDAGLSFGASFRVDHEDADGASRASNGTAGVVWIEGTYGKLSMGDPLSASEAAIGDLYSVGYTEGTFGGDVEEISYLSGDGAINEQGPTILYEYSINGFSLYASGTDASDNNWPGAFGEDDIYVDEDGAEVADGDEDSDMAWSIAGKYDGEYTGGTYSIGLGYGKWDDTKEITLGGEITYGGFSGKAIYVDYDERNDFSLYIDQGPDLTLTSDSYEYDRTFGLSAAYEYQAWTFKGFWRRDEFELVVEDDDLDDEEMDSFGLGVDYDLGGGAVLAAGVIDTDYANDTVFDAGIRFKF